MKPRTSRLSRRTVLDLEHLERRDAPATMVSANRLTYQDMDGDNVSVVFSKPILNAGNVDSIFKFSIGAVDGDNSLPQPLDVIDLTGVAAAGGTSIRLTAVRSSVNGGDGFANVGLIDASGHDLGRVSIDGDLSRILAGNGATAGSGLRGLTVQSLGRFAVGTSTISGKLDFLRVKSDIVGSSVDATGMDGAIGPMFVGGSLLGTSSFTGRITSSGDIASVAIKGSIVGGPAASSDSALISANGKIGNVTIGGSLRGTAANTAQIRADGSIGIMKIGVDVVGGPGDDSAQVFAGGSIAGATVGGSVKGAGLRSARISSVGAMGMVRIAGNVTGSDKRSAEISSQSKLAGVTIGGSLIGGTGFESGRISSLGAMGMVRIAGSVTGGSNAQTGEISSQSTLAGVTIGGSLTGDGGASGRIVSIGAMGMVRIAGNVVSGSGDGSAQISSQSTLAGVTIGGSFTAGAGTGNTKIASGGAMGQVRISGDVAGGSGTGSGEISSQGTLAGVTIGGSLTGGAGTGSGDVFALGAMGTVRIAGDVTGGNGTASGGISSQGALTRVVIGGSLRKGAGNGGGEIFALRAGQINILGDVSGTVFTTESVANLMVRGSLLGDVGRGRIIAGETIGQLTIKGDVIGGSASGTTNLQQTGFITAKRIGNLNVGGSVIAGVDNTTGTFVDNGAIRVTDDLGTVKIGGDLVGNSTNPVIISARGQAVPAGTTDRAIGSLTVLGRVERAQILAGYDVNNADVNADAQIGNVFVSGDWITSNLVAGVDDGGDDLFGTNDDQKSGGKDVVGVFSKIGNVTINGQALGTMGGTDHFGIVAENVGAVAIGGTMIPLLAGNGNDNVAIGITGDFRVNEV